MIESGIFHHIYHIGCAFNLRSIINSGLILGDQKFKQKTNRKLFAYWSQGQNVTRILTRLTWMYHAVYNTCTMHGKDIKTRKIGSTLILWFRKVLKFYQARSNAIILQGTLPVHCFPKVGSTKGQENWVRKLFDDQKGKLLDSQKEKLLDKQNSSNQPNQLQVQIVTDRGELMTCKMEETRAVLRRSMLIRLTKDSVLQTERGDLLFLKTRWVSMLSRLMTERSDLTTLKYVIWWSTS